MSSGTLAALPSPQLLFCGRSIFAPQVALTAASKGSPSTSRTVTMMRTALMTRTRLSAPLIRGFAEDKSMMDSVKETIGRATGSSLHVAGSVIDWNHTCSRGRAVSQTCKFAVDVGERG